MSVATDWISAATSLGTLIMAGYALTTWRGQLRGSTKHAIAQETATAARALRYAFYGARSRMIDGWEFPQPFTGLSGAGNEQLGDAYAHVYGNRFKELWPHVRALADLRARCGEGLSDDVAKEVENLAMKARTLQFFMHEHVEQMRAGPEVVKMWTDQEFVKKVKSSVYADGDAPDDQYSREFEAQFQRLRRLLGQYL